MSTPSSSSSPVARLRAGARASVALATAVALLTSSGCALFAPDEPRSDLELKQRLERLDEHLEESRKAAEWRRQVNAGVTGASGIALIGVGMYVRTLEAAAAEETPTTDDQGSGGGSFSTSMFVMGGVLAGVGVFLYFVPSATEIAAKHYSKRRADPNDAEEAIVTQLTFGERTLQSAALTDLQQRLEYGIPMLLGGVGLLALATATGDQVDTQGITAFATLGLLSAIGGGLITFNRTEAERRWSQYQDEVEAMQSGQEPSGVSLDVQPVLLPEGAGLVGQLTF